MSRIKEISFNDSGTMAVLKIETEQGPYCATVMTELGANRLLEFLGLPPIHNTDQK